MVDQTRDTSSIDQFKKRVIGTAISSAVATAFTIAIGILINVYTAQEAWVWLVAHRVSFLAFSLLACSVSAVVFGFAKAAREFRRSLREPVQNSMDRKGVLEALDHIPSWPEKPIELPEGGNSIQVNQLVQGSLGVLTLLDAIGVISLQNNHAQPSSELSDAFLASLRAHLADGNRNYFGDWSAGSGSPAGHQLKNLLQQWELHRIETAPGGEGRPCRLARVALALIRVDFRTQPKFLMLKDPMWDPMGGWWFVGGIQESHDNNDLRATLTRELCEELGIVTKDILAAVPFAVAADRRMSERLGIYTEYRYELFSTQLSQNSPRVRSLLVDAPRISVDHHGSSRMHEFRWFTWEELSSAEHLVKHTPSIVDALKRADYRQIPATAFLGTKT